MGGSASLRRVGDPFRIEAQHVTGLEHRSCPPSDRTATGPVDEPASIAVRQDVGVKELVDVGAIAVGRSFTSDPIRRRRATGLRPVSRRPEEARVDCPSTGFDLRSRVPRWSTGPYDPQFVGVLPKTKRER